MSHRVYILVVAGLVLFGGAATYYWVEDARRGRQQASHNIFEALDKSAAEPKSAPEPDPQRPVLERDEKL